MNRATALRSLIASGQDTIGAWLTIPDLTVTEIMAGAGFDWLIVDCEHGLFDLSQLHATLSACKSSPVTVLVRVAFGDNVLVQHALDLGADGIVFPQITNAQAAQNAVAACKYPPNGNRSYGPRRASDYYRSISTYLTDANEGNLVFLQIESMEAVAHIDEIIDVPGVDAIFPGPMDLAASAGNLGNASDEKVIAALDTIMTACNRLRMPLCAGLATSAQFPKSSQGRYLLAAFDDRLLTNAAANTVHDAKNWITNSLQK